MTQDQDITSPLKVQMSRRKVLVQMRILDEPPWIFTDVAVVFRGRDDDFS